MVFREQKRVAHHATSRANEYNMANWQIQTKLLFCDLYQPLLRCPKMKDNLKCDYRQSCLASLELAILWLSCYIHAINPEVWLIWCHYNPIRGLLFHGHCRQTENWTRVFGAHFCFCPKFNWSKQRSRFPVTYFTISDTLSMSHFQWLWLPDGNLT